jgi:hypothetical protein
MAPRKDASGSVGSLDGVIPEQDNDIEQVPVGGRSAQKGGTGGTGSIPCPRRPPSSRFQAVSWLATRLEGAPRGARRRRLPGVWSLQDFRGPGLSWDAAHQLGAFGAGRYRRRERRGPKCIFSVGVLSAEACKYLLLPPTGNPTVACCGFFSSTPDNRRSIIDRHRCPRSSGYSVTCPTRPQG